jgi:hypothetical protein
MGENEHWGRDRSIGSMRSFNVRLSIPHADRQTLTTDALVLFRTPFPLVGKGCGEEC